MLGIFSLCDVMYVIIKIFVQYRLLQDPLVLQDHTRILHEMSRKSIEESL
jgi:hypothetical protein